MLSRILAFSFCCALALVAWKRSAESTLAGMWRVTTEESAGKIRFDANHTFTGGEWSLTATHQPPVIPDDGEWRVRDSKLTGFIWPRLWRRTTTRSYAIFICDCELLANQPNWPSPRPCENCLLSSTARSNPI